MFNFFHNKSFASSEYDPATHAELIRKSHERSRSYGIDPNQTQAPMETRLSREGLRRRIEQNQPFYDLVTTQMTTLYQILKGSGFCMAVADRDGYILKILGDPQLLDHYKAANCVPGFRWTERDVGTAAIGLVLENGIPIQVSGEEMYCVRAHHITNSAAPVYDHRNRLLGVIALSGKTRDVHIHTLGMVILTAEAIRSQVSELEKARELALRNRYMTALLESDHRGVVALDLGGGIVQLNRKARSLLGILGNAEGTPIDSLLATPVAWSRFIRSGRGFAERELHLKSGGGEHGLMATLDPITLDGGENSGGLLLLMERDRVLKLVNRVAGSQAQFTFGTIIGKSAPIKGALKLARAAARGNASVLLYGETGTGKELFAQAIHNASERKRSPFVVINCGAIPRELLESELFGYAEGAFTGALKGGRPGKFELASGGTLFLDEIGDMPIDMQVKILRALQSREVQRVGGQKPIPVDLRIIVATNVNLEEAIRQSRFRQDLFYRISTLKIEIPPLRQREGDSLLLAETFLSRIGGQLGKPDLAFSPEALRLIQSHGWPGNVRQLENAVERAVNVAETDTLLEGDLGLPASAPAATLLPDGKVTLLRDVESALIAAQMEEHGGNISKVARVLGVSRPTLYRKLRKYAIPEQ